MSYFSQAISKEFLLQQVLDGEAYFAHHEFTSVSAGSLAEMLIQTGSRQMIAIMDIVAEAESRGDLYEGTTFSAAGTSVPLRNLNRNSANTALSTITHSPTITSDGTLLEDEKIYAGGTMQFSADRSLQLLWILKPNTNYLLRTGNESGAAEDILETATLVEFG